MSENLSTPSPSESSPAEGRALCRAGCFSGGCGDCWTFGCDHHGTIAIPPAPDIAEFTRGYNLGWGHRAALSEPSPTEGLREALRRIAEADDAARRGPGSLALRLGNLLTATFTARAALTAEPDRPDDIAYSSVWGPGTGGADRPSGDLDALPRCEHGAIREPCIPCREADRRELSIQAQIALAETHD